MADHDLLGDFNAENNYHSEDFETVDKIPEQDEEITSSYVGEEAEADRYESGHDPVDQLTDLINIGSSGQTAFANNDPYSYQSPVPTAPPKDLGDFMFDNDKESTELMKNLNEDEPKPEVSKHFMPDPVCKKTCPLETASWLKNVDPRVLELIYWRDVKKTGLVFGTMLFILLSLAIFSVLSVLAYLSLAVLTVTLSFRIYKNVLAAVQKSGDAHPFRTLLDMNIDLPEDKAQQALKTICQHINCTVKELRRLFLIEDLVDSLKFALLLWVLTYIGSWFNGMTLVIIGVVDLFTLPKIYETYKVQIDNYVGMACKQICNVKAQVVAKLPFLKKKEKAQ